MLYDDSGFDKKLSLILMLKHLPLLLVLYIHTLEHELMAVFEVRSDIKQGSWPGLVTLFNSIFNAYGSNLTSHNSLWWQMKQEQIENRGPTYTVNA